MAFEKGISIWLYCCNLLVNELYLRHSQCVFVSIEFVPFTKFSVLLAISNFEAECFHVSSFQGYTINFPKLLFSGFFQFILPIHTKHLNWFLVIISDQLSHSYNNFHNTPNQISKMLFYFFTSLIFFVFFVDICFIFIFLLLSHQLLWSWKLPVDFISQLWSRFPRNHRHNIFFTPESSKYCKFYQ